MEFFRNWKQICKITDLNLRLALALITDEALLEGLRRGFPKCFSRKRTKDPCVSASVIKERAYQAAVEEESSYVNSHRFDQETAWYHVLDEFDIPAGPYWFMDGVPVPPEVREQLIGQVIGSGMKIVWQDQAYIVTFFYHSDVGCSNDDLGHILAKSEVFVDEMSIGLTPARFIDLNS